MRHAQILDRSSLLRCLSAVLGRPEASGVPLTALDQYVVAHGYGGAKSVADEHYRSPIIVKGKAAI